MKEWLPLCGWVMMLFVGLTSVAAEKTASGSFVTVRAEAQELTRVGEEDFRGVSADHRAVSYKIKPKKGWKLQQPKNGKLDLSTGELSSYSVTGLMGEDGGTGTVHTCDSVTTIVTNHIAPVLSVVASGAADRILVPPEVTSAQLAIAGNVTVISNGVHTVITTITPCSVCGLPHSSVTTNTVAIVPANYCWTWSVAGTNGSAVGSALAASACVTNPAYHALSVTATATNLPTCCACSAQASTNCAVYQLESETIATAPTNRKRRKLGIGEEVVCRIIPFFSEGQWRKEGRGNISLLSGTQTKFTASKTPSNTNTVIVDVGNLSARIPFDVVPPAGMVVTGICDPVFYDLHYVKPGTNYVAAATRFTCYVQPQDVSFYNADFRENIPLTAYTWPSGTNYQYSSVFRSWKVLDQENRNIDLVDSDFFPVKNLFNGSTFVDFSYSVPVPEEYLNEEGKWISWLPDERHDREFCGSDRKARVKMIISNEMYGPWMGPWE